MLSLRTTVNYLLRPCSSIMCLGLMIPSPPSLVGSERRILSLSFRAMRPDKEGIKEYLMTSSRGASWS